MNKLHYSDIIKGEVAVNLNICNLFNYVMNKVFRKNSFSLNLKSFQSSPVQLPQVMNFRG